MSEDVSRGAAWPLAGLHVLDLSTGISGPYATKLLVDAGAEVVKLEAPGGDPLRRFTASGHALAPGEDGALFRYLNSSKRSVVADLASEAGRALLFDLAENADLVVESEAPGTLAALGVTLEALQARNPALSLVSITPWGTTGPYANRPATEFTLQAAIGAIGYRGLPDRDPVCAGGRIGEWAAGSFAANGAMAAWLSARNTGEGQHVDVSMFESMVLCLTIYHDLNGQWVEGPLGRSIEIPSVEPAKDGWVGFCTITGQQWLDFCSLIGHPELAREERYLDAKNRLKDRAHVVGLIHAWTRERTVDEIIELASLMRIPVAPIGTEETVLQMDHLVERGSFLENEDGFVQPGIPYRLEKTALRPLGRAPRLDEHAESVRTDGFTTASASPSESGPALPLAGLRVVDLSAFWAGPIVTTLLADLGADVLKVESIQRPDGMRFAGAIPNEQLWEWSPVFHGANPGKRDVTLQLDSQEGLALVKRLIADADVVIENYSARVFENFGLDWDTVHALNPRAIMVRMPAFGLSGPWRDRAGFAMTIEQTSGLAWVTGYEDQPLVLRGACDPIGGMHAAFALLMALEDRKRTGQGQLVEVALLEAALAVAAQPVLEFTAYGERPRRLENRGPVGAPQGLYRCATPEAYLAIAVASDEQWAALGRVMGEPEWAGAAELARAEGRRAAHDEIDAGLTAWLADKTQEDAVELLLAAGIPAAAVINAHDLHPNPQLEAREFFQTMEHPVTGKTRYPGFPMRFGAFGPHLHRSPPPTLGQDNETVLREQLGLDDEEIEGLRERKVIGNRPSFM